MKQAPEMDPIPDRLFISTTLDDLRQQKTRLWVKALILSILLGIFAISTAVLAVLYGKSPHTYRNGWTGRNNGYTATKACALAPPPLLAETLSTVLPTSTVTVTESGTRVRIITTTATTSVTTTAEPSVTTTADISVTTTTSVSTTTLVASGKHSG